MSKDKSKDYIIRATAGKGSIRAFFINGKEMADEAQRIHQSSPVVTAAMGRLLSAAAMMGSMLKGDDVLTIGVKGDGPMEGAVVTANSGGLVKGYPYVPEVDIPLKSNGKLDVSGALGQGTLSVVKDIGLKEPYVGQVQLVSGEIAEDLADYYVKSEQTPSAVALGVLIDRDYSVKQSAGFIIQTMPGADEIIVNLLEDRLKELRPLTALLDEGNTIEEIMEALLGDMDLLINEHLPVKYHCNCSFEKVEKSLIAIGREELEQILLEEGKANLHCHFCGKDYLFDETHLRKLLES